MLAKSIIAGTVLSLMAGGVVYFGTDVDAAGLKDKVVSKTTDVKADISDKVMAGGKDHPHDKKVETPKVKTSVTTPSVKTPSGKLIEAKKPTVSYSNESEKKTVKVTQDSELTVDPAPQKKWLDQYLKTETPETEAGTKTVTTKTVVAEEIVTEDIEGPEDETSIAEELMASMGLTPETASDSDTGTFIVEEGDEELTEEEIEIAEAEGFEARALETENIWVEDGSDETGRKKATRKMLRDIIKKDRAIIKVEGPKGEAKNIEVKVIGTDDGETTIETETIDMGDGQIMKIVKKTMKSESGHHKEGHGKDGHKKMRIKVMTDKDGMSAEDIKVFKFNKSVSIDELLDDAKSKDISATVKIVMEQAEKIKMPELRDRAYLDLVSYGLDHGDYKVAAKALKKINQVELRDTARNRIAVAYAKDGNTEDAFNILEDLEVDALRDVMRLQVIEAMIAPDELPKDMQ